MVGIYSSSVYIQAECSRNQAIIKEINQVCIECETTTDKENNILQNLFMPITNAIRPYFQFNDDNVINYDAENNPINDSYWWDMEQKYKKKKRESLTPKRRNVTNVFAIIAVVDMVFFMIQRVSFNAYIVEIVTEYFWFEESMGYYLITAFWIGSVIGRVLNVAIIKAFAPENILLFCGIWMILTSILYIITSFITANIAVKILLYVVAFSSGCAAAPLYNANLAFLSHIQPITGALSASLMIAEVVGKGIAALMTAFIIEEHGLGAQIYIHLATSIGVALLMGTNKIRYLFFDKK